MHMYIMYRYMYMYMYMWGIKRYFVVQHKSYLLDPMSEIEKVVSS